jgi:5-hydroxyisourate hydrolase
MKATTIEAALTMLATILHSGSSGLRHCAEHRTHSRHFVNGGLMGKLTTHVLDTHSGVPAASVSIELYALTAQGAELITSQITGRDGRCGTALLEDSEFHHGRFRLVFKVADYFRSRNVALPDPPFIEEACIAIGIATPEQHYHVPLLITPWSYSVYRGG